MQNNYDGLVFVGKGLGATVGIYPTFIKVRIDKKHPYKFNKFDRVDSTAIKYYKSLECLGIRLHKADDAPIVEEPKIENKVIDEKPSIIEDTVTEEVDAIIPVEGSIEPTPEEVAPTEEPTPEVVEEVEDEVTPTTEEVSTESEESEEVSSDTAELYEYLDVTYDQSQLVKMAKELGVKCKSNTSKNTLINRIIDSKKDYIINLIQNS